MRRCPREEELDWAAVHLLRAGVSPEEPGDLPPALADFAPLRRHLDACARCREILGLLLETERTSQSEEVAGRILPLAPLVAAQGATDDADAPGLDEAQEYPAAADSHGARPAGEEAAASLVLTLTTQDQRYVVRIFPNQGGTGATAVLLGESSRSGKPRLGSSLRKAGFSLRVGEDEYWFDENGYAHLTAFPAGAIALIVK